MLLLALPLLAAACGTSYQPRDSALVSLVIDRGALVYLHEGRRVVVGPLGGGLQPLVADTPAAAAHAKTGEKRLAIGIPTYLTGATGVLTGVLILSGPIGWIAIGVGAGAMGTGVGLLGSGVTHLVDAVHIHNDAATERSASLARAPVVATGE